MDGFGVSGRVVDGDNGQPLPGLTLGLSNESQFAAKLRSPDEGDMRTRLRREAEAAKTEIEFKPCQDVMGYQLLLSAPLPRSIKNQ